ncbi:hypothetical protein NPIL_704371 [Nephila pilipes]|uniref:Uncharacterized protein n=1 Tax=Nephila pilipes TaxID=299642 RepID=A0A8X6NLK1_NEPPI|nr:hypothetical protein NPIL_704371 [Nephila pilipes]
MLRPLAAAIHYPLHRHGNGLMQIFFDQTQADSRASWQTCFEIHSGKSRETPVDSIFHCCLPTFDKASVEENVKSEYELLIGTDMISLLLQLNFLPFDPEGRLNSTGSVFELGLRLFGSAVCCLFVSVYSFFIEESEE